MFQPDDIRKGLGWIFLCCHKINSHYPTSVIIMFNRKYSLQNVINEQPNPAKPNSDGFQAWFPHAVPWWANLTEIRLMNCSAFYHRKTKRTLLESLLHFQQHDNELKQVILCPHVCVFVLCAPCCFSRGEPTLNHNEVSLKSKSESEHYTELKMYICYIKICTMVTLYLGFTWFHILICFWQLV